MNGRSFQGAHKYSLLLILLLSAAVLGGCGGLEHHEMKRIVLVSETAASVTAAESSALPGTSDFSYESSIPQNGKVYITKTGKRYHYSPDCSKNSFETTLSEALEKGLTPCKKCVE